MFDTTILVVSDDATLIRPVEAVIRTMDGLGLSVLAHVELAHAYDSWDRVALVVMHVKDEGPSTEIVRLLRLISEAKRTVAMLVIADHPDEDQASMLLRLGIADYLGRPLDSGRLAYLMDVLTVRARDAARSSSTASTRSFEPELNEAVLDVPGDNEDSLMTQVRRVAPQDATILLSGETGTGKSRLARRIHELSARRSDPFVVINCGSLAPAQIEAEMFGRPGEPERPGKFAQAGRGTLFFDEIDSLPTHLQARLLRVVEDRVFEEAGSTRGLPLEARLIAASNRSLEREVEADRFRSDLYYRLNVIGFRLPPLRERRGVIPSLVSKFIAEFSSRNGGGVDSIAAPALQALEGYDWPGNIRELRNTVERAVAVAAGQVIQLEDLSDSITRRDCPASPVGLFLPSAFPVAGVSHSTLAEIKRDAELARITEALEKHSNNRLRAASELGISRMTLYKKLYKYGLMQANPAQRGAGN